MSTGVRVPLAEADAVAHELVAVLDLGCDRIAVAGSIRRRRPDIGDVEIVAVPRIRTETVVEGLFAEERQVEVDELQVLVDALVLKGTLASHPTDSKHGARYSKLLHPASGLQVDLFSARPSTFGLIYLIRTGPATYSQWLATEARRRAHHVAGGELHRGGMGCGSIPCPVVPTPDERDVYAALRLPFAPPEQRA